MARGAGNYRRFTEAEKAEMKRLWGEGKTYTEIGREIGHGGKRVADWFRLSRDAPPGSYVARPKKVMPTLPVADGGIAPPTKAQLMGRR